MARMSPKKRVTDRSLDSMVDPNGPSIQYSPLRPVASIPVPKWNSKGADRKMRKPRGK
jgi:hypothetical protein